MAFYGVHKKIWRFMAFMAFMVFCGIMVFYGTAVETGRGNNQ
jgi:hypothetical protein